MNKAQRAVIALALAVLVLTAAGCGQPTAVPAGDAAQGQTVWAGWACAGCHGINGEGSSAGPALVRTPLTFKDFKAITRRGGPGMPKFGVDQASDRDLEDAFAWLVAGAQAAAGGQPIPSAAPADGQAAWAQSPCAGCHGANGDGGTGPALTGTTQPLANLQAIVRQGKGSMPSFSAAQVSDQTLQTILAWLQGQTATQPQNPWVQVGCAGCHGANAEGASAPGLAGEGDSFDSFQRAVRRGEEGMPAYSSSQISDQDLRSVYDWLMSLP